MTEGAHKSDRELLEASQAGSREATEALTERHDALVKYVAKRFYRGGRDMDDLLQLGRVGLLKAIRNFDLRFEVKFSTYAVPVIMGEIRRFLRDDSQIHVSRTIRENAARIRAYRQRHAQVCSVEEIGRALGIDPEDALLALNADQRVRSLDEPVTDDGLLLCDTLGADDSEARVEHLELERMLAELSERDRSLIERRYFLEQTQSRIARDMGLSQVQVSRLESRILKRLREAAT